MNWVETVTKNRTGEEASEEEEEEGEELEYVLFRLTYS
jgi:hypothetical protein